MPDNRAGNPVRGARRFRRWKVIETLGFIVREGVQWREFRATGGHVSGAPVATAWTSGTRRRCVRMGLSGPFAGAWDAAVGRCSA
ncbi:hypothetical protein JL101_032670 (plasmid) [Skermanella rosea]|uniref:hypothetical protein n=1 Tax=Skermanella rosea TaxID=1817965 RepID=UPI0019326B05|nr:hypothetical protein [Skermanella rosea]UEM07663.1 hypothetical protein JL101_032670 [Skermanella rosea]